MVRTFLFIASLILLQACSSYSLREEFYRGEVKYQFELGDKLYKQGKYKEATAAYMKISHLVPDNAEAHAAIGNAYLALGDRENALQNYRRAIVLKPELENALEPALAYALSTPKPDGSPSINDLVLALDAAEQGNLEKWKALAGSIPDPAAWADQLRRVFRHSNQTVSKRLLQLYANGRFSACPTCIVLAGAWCSVDLSPEYFSLVLASIKHASGQKLAAVLAYRLGLAYEKHGDRRRALDIYLMYPDDIHIAKRLKR
ncbi:MAG: tetratricopeptide repeat protein [Mariprofundaceae bacterium]|nr:tetratricopeptide repeat protein [Mariprofundaceae bacterium]